MSAVLIALLAVLGVGLVFAGLYLPRTGPDVLAERLADITYRPHTLEEIELQQPFGDRVLRPMVRSVADALRRYQVGRGRAASHEDNTVAQQEKVLLKLALAGNPYGWTPSDFLGTKALAALVLGGGLFLLMGASGKPMNGFTLGAAGAALGWFGPDLVLRSRTAARQKAIQRALPDALDLLVISVEAGLGFDAALQRLVDKRTDPLTLEFARVLAELRVGRSRREALHDMVMRTQVPDLNNFVSALLQAESLGVSVTRVLSVQADQMRTVRRQRAEEAAAKLQLKMLFPLVIFIFPALCIVIMGPVWPSFAANGAPGL